MAYEKQVWNCGDTITADKMNHIEEGIKNAQNGYECEETYTLLLEETATTAEQAEDSDPSWVLSYSNFIDADKLRITLNDVVYEVEKASDSGEYASYYGDVNGDYSKYPFDLQSSNTPMGVENTLYTQSEGTYTIKIAALEVVATTTECFDTAVRKATGSSGNCVRLRVGYTDETKQESNDPIIPTEINYLQFKNTEAISIAQGQYGTVTLYAITTTKFNMMFAIMNIYVADNGHLPPITSIRVEPDPNNNGKVVYKVEMYARDSAISIANGKLILDALSFELPTRTTSFCVVEGTCCENAPT